MGCILCATFVVFFFFISGSRNPNRKFVKSDKSLLVPFCFLQSVLTSFLLPISETAGANSPDLKPQDPKSYTISKRSHCGQGGKQTLPDEPIAHLRWTAGLSGAHWLFSHCLLLYYPWSHTVFKACSSRRRGLGFSHTSYV